MSNYNTFSELGNFQKNNANMYFSTLANYNSRLKASINKPTKKITNKLQAIKFSAEEPIEIDPEIDVPDTGIKITAGNLGDLSSIGITDNSGILESGDIVYSGGFIVRDGEILFPDGSPSEGGIVNADGTIDVSNITEAGDINVSPPTPSTPSAPISTPTVDSTVTNSDGSITSEMSDGSTITKFPDNTTLTTKTNSDGSISVSGSDGSSLTFNTDNSIDYTPATSLNTESSTISPTITDPSTGITTTKITNADGSSVTTVIDPSSGTITETNVDSSGKVTSTQSTIESTDSTDETTTTNDADLQAQIAKLSMKIDDLTGKTETQQSLGSKIASFLKDNYGKVLFGIAAIVIVSIALSRYLSLDGSTVPLSSIEMGTTSDGAGTLILNTTSGSFADISSSASVDISGSNTSPSVDASGLNPVETQGNQILIVQSSVTLISTTIGTQSQGITSVGTASANQLASSTTITAGGNPISLGFPSSGTITVQTTTGFTTISYTGITTTTFTGCTGGTGTLLTNGSITAPSIALASSSILTVVGNPINLNFPTSGIISVQTTAGYTNITYSGITSTSFTGCTGGVGTLASNGSVTLIKNTTSAGTLTVHISFDACLSSTLHDASYLAGQAAGSASGGIASGAASGVGSTISGFLQGIGLGGLVTDWNKFKKYIVIILWIILGLIILGVLYKLKTIFGGESEGESGTTKISIQQSPPPNLPQGLYSPYQYSPNIYPTIYSTPNEYQPAVYTPK